MKFADLKEGEIYRCSFDELHHGYWVIRFESSKCKNQRFIGSGSHSKRLKKVQKCSLADFPSGWAFQQASLDDKKIFQSINNSYEVC